MFRSERNIVSRENIGIDDEGIRGTDLKPARSCFTDEKKPKQEACNPEAQMDTNRNVGIGMGKYIESR